MSAREDGKAARKRSKWTYVHIHKAHHGCQDCGEKDPEVLDLDHVRGRKLMEVSRMVNNDLSIERINDELDKCDVVCANCHRRRGMARRGGYGGASSYTVALA